MKTQTVIKEREYGAPYVPNHHGQKRGKDSRNQSWRGKEDAKQNKKPNCKFK